MIDYETLRVIWWLLLGTLLTGFAVTDGFDLGTAALVRVLGKHFGNTDPSTHNGQYRKHDQR